MRERFFVSMARRVVARVLTARSNASLLPEVERWIFDGVEELPDTSADALSEQLLCEPTALGWAYQVWNSDSRDASSWAISKKAESRHENIDIASVTQVFTDRYIADFLVSRCFNLWRAGPNGQQACPTVCDPAVGTGHLLVAAISGCVARGVVVDEIARRIYGYDIDPLSVVLARTAVLCEIVRCGFLGDIIDLCRGLKRSIRAIDQLYGSLDRQAISNDAQVGFDIVLANPPYLGRRKIPAAFRDFLDREYPAASVDLCAAFLQRCVELLANDGLLGVVASDKWMRLKQYASLRDGDTTFKGLYGELAIDGIYELGERAFSRDAELHDGMRAALLVARKAQVHAEHRVVYARLSQLATQAEKEAELSICDTTPEASRYVTTIQQSELASGRNVFLKVSGLPERFACLSSRVGDCCNVVVGIQTSDDSAFVRYLWQVPEDRTGWRVHCKGGGYGRWSGLARWAIDWRAGAGSFLGSSAAMERAEQWVEKDGWVYSWFANGNLGVRRKQRGWSFGRAAAGGVFVDDRRLVAFLNSRIASAAVRSIGGKIQLPEGVVRAIPAPSDIGLIDGKLVDLVVEVKERRAAAELTEALFRSGEIPDFEAILELEAHALVIEGCLEDQVERSLDLSIADRMALVERLGMMTGWYVPSLSMQEYGAYKRLPREHQDILSRYSGITQGVLVLGSKYTTSPHLETIILAAKGGASGDTRSIFPPSGIVERVCRELRIHPYDALAAICNVVKYSRGVAQKLNGQHLAKCLVEEVLNQLGFRWWNAPSAGGKNAQSAISFDDVVSLAQERFRNVAWRELFGISAEVWVAQVFSEWHERYFFGASPLVVKGDRRLFKTVELRWK